MKSLWKKISDRGGPSVRYYTEVVVALVLFVQGVLVMIPAYDLPDQTFWNFIGSPAVQEALGATLIISSLLILAGLAVDHHGVRRIARRTGTLLAFLVFTLLTFIGVISEQVNDIYWLATAGLAVLSAVMYVKIGRHMGSNG